MDVHIRVYSIETGFFHGSYKTKINLSLIYEDGIFIEQCVYINGLLSKGRVNIHDFLTKELCKYVSGNIIISK